MLTQYVIAFCVTALTHFVLAVIIYAKGRQRLTNITYALYSVAISWWSIFEAVSITRPDAQTALFWWRLNHVGVIFIPVFFVHFVVSLLEPHQQARRRYVIRGIYLFGLIALILNATPILIREVVPKFSFKYFINPGLVYHVFFALWVSLAIYGLVELFRVYATSARAKRNQLTYFCWSMFVAYLGGIPNFLPTFNIEIPYLMPFGTYAIPLYALATAYAIVRYRLMDINLALTRGAIFVGVYACVISLPFLLAVTRQEFLETVFGRQWWGVPLGLMALLATLGHYVNLFFQRKAEARLLREQRRYQTTLLNAAKGMTRIRDLQHLLDLIVHILTRSMKLTHAGVFLRDEPTGQYVLHASRDRDILIPGLVVAADDPLIQWLQDTQAPLVSEELRQLANGQATSPTIEDTLRRIEASVIIPSFAEDELSGFLLLGDKKTGQMYSQDDLNVLQTLANQAAMAVQNARFYDELQTKTAELIHTSRLTSMGKMASGIAHQMRNRFACLMGEADLAQALLQQLSPATTPQKQQETVQVVAKKLTSICEEGQKGLVIVKNLLEYSKPATNRELISLREVVDRGLAQLSIKHDLSQFALYLQVPKEHPYVHVNPSEWQDVFFNLLDNAAYWVRAKASLVEHGHLTVPAGELPFGPKIAITAQPSDDRAKLLIRIADNGLGIEAKEQDKLFLPFFTLKASSEEKTGIGLYFVWIIVKAHGGIIRLEHSEYGKGTTFLIELPIPDAERQWLASSS